MLIEPTHVLIDRERGMKPVLVAVCRGHTGSRVVEMGPIPAAADRVKELVRAPHVIKLGDDPCARLTQCCDRATRRASACVAVGGAMQVSLDPVTATRMPQIAPKVLRTCLWRHQDVKHRLVCATVPPIIETG